MTMKAEHQPVLMQEVLDALDVAPSETVVDATLGGAGHFRALLALLSEGGVIIGIDADSAAVERARAAYAEDRRPNRPVAHILNDNFRNLERILERLNITPVHKVLFDLGWSGYQIAAPRGFSFQNEAEPLLMNYSDSDRTAADIVNGFSEAELADLIYAYGEERYARSIAKSIVKARAKERILTVGGLVAAIRAGTPRAYQNGKLHPATKTFQALRIAVNEEMESLAEGLAAALGCLSPGGRIAVISFHSIEDRVVKHIFREAVEKGMGTLALKKPVTPSRAEVLANRRARSAKLRVFERLSVLIP